MQDEIAFDKFEVMDTMLETKGAMYGLAEYL